MATVSGKLVEHNDCFVGVHQGEDYTMPMERVGAHKDGSKGPGFYASLKHGKAYSIYLQAPENQPRTDARRAMSRSFISSTCCKDYYSDLMLSVMNVVAAKSVF